MSYKTKINPSHQEWLSAIVFITTTENQRRTTRSQSLPIGSLGKGHESSGKSSSYAGSQPRSLLVLWCCGALTFTIAQQGMLRFDEPRMPGAGPLLPWACLVEYCLVESFNQSKPALKRCVSKGGLRQREREATSCLFLGQLGWYFGHTKLVHLFIFITLFPDLWDGIFSSSSLHNPFDGNWEP